MNINEKYDFLIKYLKSLESVTIAFSSGVDSTFLLKSAVNALPKNKILAVTVKSYLFPNRELNESIEFCKTEGIKHIIIDADELNINGFSENPPNRCYLCKLDLFKKIIAVSNDNEIKNICEGSNMDDLGDYRPGLKSIEELNVKSPLREADLYKNEIRELSKNLGLKTFDKPSFACLASRFVYGEEITKEKLNMVDKSEQLLLNLGFKQMRVRIHSNIARIEVLPQEFQKLIDNKEKIVSSLKDYGFDYVTMDLQGYRTGSMNETLNDYD